MCIEGKGKVMATLNKTRNTVKNETIAKEKTVNFHGEVAYTLKPHQLLVERVLGAFWNEKSFYKSGEKASTDIVKDINAVLAIDPKFVLQLAAYARNEIYLRTTPQVLLVHAANHPDAKQYIQEYTPKIVKRADELGEVMAYQLLQFGKPIPNSLKKGLAIAFSKFDEYQLNKYDSAKDAVSLGDVLQLIARRSGYPVSKAMYDFLVHDKVDAEGLPKIAALKALLARDKLDATSKSLIKESNVTWETLISKFGSSKETWELVAPNMGYMALLRNLRNFIDKDVDLEPILAKIQDEEQVKRSKQLPFRFYSAYKNVRGNQKVERAIAQAFEHSITNVTLPGSTAVIIDLSGSMGSPLSGKSDILYSEIGAVLGAIAVKKASESVVIKFADRAKVAHVNPDDTMMTNLGKLQENEGVGGGTNPVSAIPLLHGHNVDRVLFLSDMQCYSSRYGYAGGLEAKWNVYHKDNPKSHLYSFDLSAYGTSQFPSTNGSVTTLNGWSDKVIDFINLLEKKDVMVSEIKKY